MRTVPCASEICNGAQKVCKLGKKIDACIIHRGISQNEHRFKGPRASLPLISPITTAAYLSGIACSTSGSRMSVSV